jgi:Holliday junction resolvase RusA-like endonuclease
MNLLASPVQNCSFTVPGTPMGKPRMTQRDKWMKRECVVRYRAWADMIRLCCPNPPPAERLARINIFAYFAPPSSWSAKKRQAMIGHPYRQKPDPDNIAKAVLDSLWPDGDQAVGSVYIERQWRETAGLCVDLVMEATL